MKIFIGGGGDAITQLSELEWILGGTLKLSLSTETILLEQLLKNNNERCVFLGLLFTVEKEHTIFKQKTDLHLWRRNKKRLCANEFSSQTPTT